MTRDGRQVTFGWSGPGTGLDKIYRVILDGSGGMEPILPGGLNGWPSSWSPDMQYLAFIREGDIDILDVAAGVAKPLLSSKFDERDPEFSPNGRWLAYASDESGRFEVYVRPFPGPGSVFMISTQGGVEPMWNPDGKELFYRQLLRQTAVQHQFMSVAVETDPGFRKAGNPTVLFDDSAYMWTTPRSYDVTSDGNRFVMVKYAGEPEQPVTEMILVQGWFEELKLQAPPARP